MAAGGDVDLIQLFRKAASEEESLARDLGGNFARGHSQATGGSVAPAAFEKLLHVLGFIDGGSRGVPKREMGGGAVQTGQKRNKTLLHFGFSRGVKAER